MSASPIDWQARASEVLSTAGSVPSPCRSVCIMDTQSGWCQGCLRSLTEIAAWGSMTDAQKRMVWQSIPARAGQA
jgi:predicted Fe-S protein YdhL (DUF1289 family)